MNKSLLQGSFCLMLRVSVLSDLPPDASQKHVFSFPPSRLVSHRTLGRVRGNYVQYITSRVHLRVHVDVQH